MFMMNVVIFQNLSVELVCVDGDKPEDDTEDRLSLDKKAIEQLVGFNHKL